MMRRFAGFIVLSSIGLAQPTPFKSYKNQEDYCRENPKMPTCIKIQPLIYKPSATPPAVPRRTAASQGGPELRPADVPLSDWRFADSSPGLLVSINIGSLLRSPLLAALLPAPAADIEKARAVLTGVGQILISLTPNGTVKPSVLMMAKGDVDGPVGIWLRSGAGMESRRIDAITMLAGDARSIQFASLRMQSPAARETANRLLQEATREALKYDVWIGIDPRHLTSLAASFGVRSNPTLSSLGALRGISLGIYLRDQLRVEASVDTPSPEIAERLLESYEQAQANQGKGQADLTWAGVEGKNVRFIEIAGAAQLKEFDGLDEDTARMIRPYFTQLIQSLATLSPRPAEPARPKPSQGAIVIQGLN
jgi:hypothetical protein